MKERLDILRQIERGELRAEEAEGILRKVDTKNQRFLCDNCLYNQEPLEIEDDLEKFFLN